MSYPLGSTCPVPHVKDRLLLDWHRMLYGIALALSRNHFGKIPGFTFDDWFQEAAIEFLDAVERWDCTRTNLSTYVMNRVRPLLWRKALGINGLVRVPSCGRYQ